MNWLKKRDNCIIYIGDGLSDLEAARHANYVFATSHLAILLTEKIIRATDDSQKTEETQYDYSITAESKEKDHDYAKFNYQTTNFKM